MSKAEKVEISNRGIKTELSRVTPEEAVAEYIWNGFDASATIVAIDYQTGDMFDNVTVFTVADDGNGIPIDLLKRKFKPYRDSEKALKKTEEKVSLEGKHGYGRLTFFKFARKAVWQTCYAGKTENESYTITVLSDSLDNYDNSSPVESTLPVGTVVTFTGLIRDFYPSYFEQKLKPFLLQEFAWYLEVHKARFLKLLFHGEELNPQNLIVDKDSFDILVYKDSDRKEQWTFKCTYIRWKGRLNDEFSKFYFLNDKGKLKRKRNTRLNNKGDNFFHSVIIQCSFFDNFSFAEVESPEEEGRLTLFADAVDYKIFHTLLDEAHTYLKKKRKPFLHNSSAVLLKSFERDKVMPKFGNDLWDKVRKAELETLIQSMYEVEPALFTQLNPEQKKTFLALLNLALSGDERQHLFNILQEVVHLDKEDRARFSNILQTTRLTNIVNALKLVHDRLLAIANLKKLVFDRSLAANEKDHIQKAVESHYWIFGEQYNLVCAAEAKFETALRNHLYILRGETKKISIQHPDKLKEMDIFLVRQLWDNDGVNNVVIELKSPSTVRTLSGKHLTQIKEYMDVILSIDEFNAQTNCTWDFYLVGQDYNNTIANEKKNAQHHGEKDLVFRVDNYKVYVKKWSEVFIDVESRLKWLNDKLLIEREKLARDPVSAQAAVISLHSSSAAQALAPSVPPPAK